MRRAYLSAGIPELFVDFDMSTLDTNDRSRELWTDALPMLQSWQAGECKSKGLIISGSQGTGKSTALWLNARAAVRSWLMHKRWDGIGTLTTPIYAKRFKQWVRFEFCPSQDGKRNWNFELIHEIVNSKAIFLDDVTFDTNNDAFRPLREFFEILVDDLSCMSNPPSLWITTNNSSEDWSAILGAQLVDRIAGPEHGICKSKKCVWKSYR